MEDEDLWRFLGRRERELRHQIAALRGQLIPKEVEMEEIQRLRASLVVTGSPVGAPVVLMPSGEALPSTTLPVLDRLTIKELVLLALRDHFPAGATAAQICDFVRDAYRRKIKPSSLRPQLARLKAEGVLRQDPATDMWKQSQVEEVRAPWFMAAEASPLEKSPLEIMSEVATRTTLEALEAQRNALRKKGK